MTRYVKDTLNELMENADFKAEWDALEHEFQIIRAMIDARKNGVENDVENGVENGMEQFSEAMLQPEKQITAIKLEIIIQDNSGATIKQVTQRFGFGVRTIRHYLKEFQDAGVLIREGSDISGNLILLQYVEHYLKVLIISK